METVKETIISSETKARKVENAKNATYKLYPKHFKLLEIYSKYFKNQQECIRWLIEQGAAMLSPALTTENREKLEADLKQNENL